MHDRSGIVAGFEVAVAGGTAFAALLVAALVNPLLVGPMPKGQLR